jgi:excisionase family DNA binding protein
MEAMGFTETDATVVMAKFVYTAENRILGAGGGKYPDPQSWMQAIERAKADEAMHAADLTENHGYPDTTGKSPREAHFARLAFLMGKYPDADWDLLMEDQDRAMERRPATMGPRVSPPVTVQMIEDAKQRFLGYREQRQELITSGDNPELLMGVIDSMAWKRRELEGYGVDITALIASDAGTASPVFGGSVVSAGVSPSVLKPAGDQGDSVEQVSVDEEPEQELSKPSDAPAFIPAATMTAKEVSERIGMTYQTVIRLLASGELPYGKKVGRNWIVARESFLAWIESNDDTVRELSEPKERKKPQPKVQEQVLPRTIRHGRNAIF